MRHSEAATGDEVDGGPGTSTGRLTGIIHAEHAFLPSVPSHMRGAVTTSGDRGTGMGTTSVCPIVRVDSLRLRGPIAH